ncbi:G patch domain-containing protein 3 [Nematolebias whitei]|uniref:G patch domain-containing protein 3 n=1 Tax=Nematolebias whitei TaxID=451745 RepID=UPI00189B9A9F|nr:G patch domain-containing protein 3 [Nematolebias whitei]
MADGENELPVYLAISNIPVAFRSADLRNYFSQFIESGGFRCFHYRHRPEVLREPERTETTTCGDGKSSSPSEAPKSGSSSIPAVATCCCIVSVGAKDGDRLIRMYAGNHWIDSKGSWLARRCVIRRIKVSPETGEGSFPYKTKYEHRHHVSLTEHFTEADLQSLPELNPPSLMQNGNVGTTVKVFLQLIQSCRLPPRLIRKLGLTFPKTGSCRRYGNVPFQYRNTRTLPATEETVLTAAGHEISGPGSLKTVLSSRSKLMSDDTLKSEADDETQNEGEGEEDAQSNADDDDDYCEEWERHEALHDDVTSQERTKERLYEEEIELKWEKGGSGLVFYTDAQYWQEEEEGDFDEQTADDWDVDMSVYYDKDGGDMDARDYIKMRYERRLREGLEDGSGHNQSIGSFERFSKGFGRRIMEKQGWKDGDGLGNSQIGISEALENDGQHPHCKRGFGYHGEKLVLHPIKKARTDYFITTVYDKPKDIDEGDTLLRRQPNTSMKYRGWQPGGSIGSKR